MGGNLLVGKLICIHPLTCIRRLLGWICLGLSTNILFGLLSNLWGFGEKPRVSHRYSSTRATKNIWQPKTNNFHHDRTGLVFFLMKLNRLIWSWLNVLHMIFVTFIIVGWCIQKFWIVNVILSFGETRLLWVKLFWHIPRVGRCWFRHEP